MKGKIIDLKVDTIGSQNDQLTLDEQKAISEFIRASKERNRVKVREQETKPRRKSKQLV